eukprot:m.99043 g.99043  ORF g.99043 m.99043 type:complete len:164 (-) comp13135_c0_seq2:34-525(-)
MMPTIKRLVFIVRDKERVGSQFLGEAAVSQATLEAMPANFAQEFVLPLKDKDGQLQRLVEQNGSYGSITVVIQKLPATATMLRDSKATVSRKTVSVSVIEAQGLPIMDDQGHVYTNPFVQVKIGQKTSRTRVCLYVRLLWYWRDIAQGYAYLLMLLACFFLYL